VDRQNGLILNGDSSQLPLPDSIVDAVVTDPPYFDFVHYSELSDFFYAWVSAGLGSHYAYLNRESCHHENEVQDRAYLDFQRKISSVFVEANRVLKSDGVLCFSYHHSKPEGWLAIANALRESGFRIVAAHPVKAEMSVASPKSAAKDPINLDMILVCKPAQKNQTAHSEEPLLEEMTSSLVQRFASKGRSLSEADKFVIRSGLKLVSASMRNLDANQTLELLNA